MASRRRRPRPLAVVICRSKARYAGGMLRLSSALLVAATGLCLLAADSAVAAKLPVARRADPSLDPYLRTQLTTTPLAAMTADQLWLSAHSNPIVAHDSDPTVSFNLLGWASKPKVAVYLNATGVNPEHPA